MEDKVKNLVELQLALQATGLKLEIPHIISILKVIDKVEDVGDQFTIKMASIIKVEAIREAQEIMKLMQELASRKIE